MKGDYSRIPFNERKKMQHYRKVYLQQGKVLLDSDLNENTDLLHYQMKTLAKDGLCGSPNIGFRIGRGVPLLPVDDHRYIDNIGEGKGWSVKNGNGTLTIDYFEKFEGKGSLKLENATNDTKLSFAFQKPVDLSQYRYLRLALKPTGANPELILKRFDGKNQTTIKTQKQEQSTYQNEFSVIKYTFPPEAVLDNITEICLSDFSSDNLIGAVECSPPMFTLELVTHLEGWSFEPAGSANVSIGNINGGGIIATQTEKLYKKHFSTVDFSKFETIEFAIKSSSTSAIEFYITDKDDKVSYWKIENLSKELKKYSKKIILPDGNDSNTAAELAFIKEYGFRGLSKDASYGFGSILYEMSLKNNFVIAGTDPLSGENGRLYVDGELYEKEEAETYLNQKDCPSAPSIKPVNGRKALVYVDVWQRHVTSAEDPELREVAVGVDTCNRMKAVAQVKVLKGETSLPYDLKPTGGGRLSTVVEYRGAEKPCEITSGVEYTGAENRLYRVEIYTGGDVGTATYKWSRNNASTVSQIIENVKGGATSVKVKDVKLFKIGDIIEITDDRVELADRKYISSSIEPWGELRRITSIDRDKNELEWAAASEASGDSLPMIGGLLHDYTAEGVETTHPRVIKWDGAKKTSKEETLEDGIKIRFSGSNMLPGDYWTFTARENTRAVEKLDNEPPQGVVHHYYPLAVIKWDENGEIISIKDLRTRFEPLCGLTAADLAFDNANTPIWKDARNVQQALERITFPKAEGIEFTNKCGDLYGKSTNNVQAALDNLCNGITVPSLALKCTDIAQSRWPKLKCSDKGDISFLAGAESLKERMRISADGNVGIGTVAPGATLEVAGNKGDRNDRNFKVTYPGGANLAGTEFSALTHTPLANGWTALYAKQGSANKAGVFDGDVAIKEGDLKIEGGHYRRLKIVSDSYWAGIELVAREKEKKGNPHIDFTHGELDSPNYGIRLYAPTNDKFVIDGGNVGIGKSPETELDVNGTVKSTALSGLWDKSSSGYVRIGNMQIAWGSLEVQTNTFTKVTFPKRFKHSSYSFIAEKHTQVAGTIYTARKTASQGEIYHNSGKTEPVTWIAIGAWQ